MVGRQRDKKAKQAGSSKVQQEGNKGRQAAGSRKLQNAKAVQGKGKKEGK